MQRARTTFIGLLGVVVATGLVAVGVMVNLDLPEFPLSPLPDPPAESQTAADVATAVPVATAPRRGRVGGGRLRLATRGEAPAAKDAVVAAPPGSDRVSTAPEAAVPVSTPARPEADPPPTAKPPPAPGSEGGAPSRPPGETDVQASQTQRKLVDEPAPAGPDSVASHPGKGKGTGTGKDKPLRLTSLPRTRPQASPRTTGPDPAKAMPSATTRDTGPHGKKVK